MKKILAYCFVALLLAPLHMVSAQDAGPRPTVRGMPECPETRALFESLAATAEQLAASQNMFQGTLEIPFVLVDFPDLPMTRSKADFEQLFNTLNLTETPDGPVQGSLRDYFREASFGKLDLIVNIYGPFTMPNPIRYYEWTLPSLGGISGSTPTGVMNMMREAARQASAEERGADRLDFRNYVLREDNRMTHFHAIFAGQGVGSGGVAGQTIFPHAMREQPGSYLLTIDGVSLVGYSVSPEFMHINYGTRLGGLGTVVHELGHSLFDLPDVYGVEGDLNYWCVMGVFNEPSPAHFSAWSRMRIGWLEPIVLDAPGVFTIPNPADGNDVVFRINTATPNEFFLLENRQQHGFDATSPGRGLLIYHVDDATTGCIMCDPARRRVYIKQASGGVHSINSDRTRDGWPQWGRTSFTDTSIPNALSWAGEPTNKPIHNITQNADGSITFRFMMEKVVPDYYSVDFAVAAPTAVHNPGEREIGVRVYNLGQPITDAEIEWSVDGVAQEPYTWSGTLDFETDMTVPLGSFYFSNETHEVSIRIQIASANIDETVTKTVRVTRPLFFENFEGDVSGWRIANGQLVNGWVIGDAVAADGNRSAYISRDGVAHEAENVANRHAHLFHSITFPQTDEDMELYFDVIGNAQLRVLTTPTTPVAGANPTGVYRHRTIGDVANWQTINITLPASRYSGQTFNLVFSWYCQGGSQDPPKAIDNVAITGPALAPQITTFATLPVSTFQTEYTTTLVAIGTLPITMEIVDGALPEGLDLCATTGIISGTPTTGGLITFTARASNNYGSEERVFTLNVRMPPAITTETLADGIIGEPYSQALTATGTTPISWLITSGSLPAGLTLSAGVISGTPTTAGDFTFTLRAGNVLGATHHAFREFTITIADTVTEPDPSSIVDVEQIETLMVFPNPVTDKLQLTTYNLQIGDIVEIFDINGRRVLSKPICQLSIVNRQLTIDISHLPSGTYIVSIGQISTRIIKR